MYNILGIIPARAGSKGIKNKNIHSLNGVPLIHHSYECAKNSKLNGFLISTNCDIIKMMYDKTEVIERPQELCEDETPMIPVIKHAINYWENRLNKEKVDAICLLQPTSPLRTTEDLNKALKAFRESESDSLYSGYYMGIKTKQKIYDKHLQKPHFQRNGAIFIASRDLIEKGLIWSDSVIEFEMPKSRSIDIDDMDDMFIAESIFRNKEKSYDRGVFYNYSFNSTWT